MRSVEYTGRQKSEYPHQCSPIGGEAIGNRVHIPNDPVTVIGNRYLPQKAACPKCVCGGMTAVTSFFVL